MSCSRFAWIGLGILFVSASAAFGAPVTFDGKIDGSDSYALTITDTDGDPSQTFQSSSWNISAAKLDMDSQWLYLGLDTLDTYDPDGTGGQSNRTSFFFRIQDNSLNGAAHDFVFISTDATTWELYKQTGGGLMPTFAAVSPANRAALIDTDLELKISLAELPGVTANLIFMGRLDDLGPWSDDIVEGAGYAPEPGTAALLLVGAAGALLRRRRKLA